MSNTEQVADHAIVERYLATMDLQPGDEMWLIGGYRGKQARIFFEHYHVQLSVFEPQSDCAAEIARELPLVKVYPFGLSGSSGRQYMAGKGTDACSFYTHIGGERTEGEVVDVAEFLQECPAPKLAMLNCEGSEIDILKRLVETGQIKLFPRLLIQFHPQVVGEAACEKAYRLLEQSHRIIWRYWWGWVYAEAYE